ncbi:hypothetical protein MUK42_37198 [Musa troglodytarum]|uniref:Uncharacterized protein n=1 Tax=Musa troglodytarum TaxID=320322 RepID=A0A9E7GD91_9LILI|nr:hypothetical protein MUK42_37198 [Musa troglodytarum]
MADSSSHCQPLLNAAPPLTCTVSTAHLSLSNETDEHTSFSLQESRANADTAREGKKNLFHYMGLGLPVALKQTNLLSLYLVHLTSSNPTLA